MVPMPVVWLAVWFLGRGPELLLAAMCELRVLLWFIGLLDYIGTHSLMTEVSTDVLWVSSGTHPCGPPPRQDGGGTRAPAYIHDVLRLSRKMWIIDVCSCRKMSNTRFKTIECLLNNEKFDKIVCNVVRVTFGMTYLAFSVFTVRRVR